MIDFNDHAVVRRAASGKTHVAFIEKVRRAHMFRVEYRAPALASARAACGVDIPTTSVIMETGTKVSCSSCKRLTGITEQSPSVEERIWLGWDMVHVDDLRDLLVGGEGQ